MSFAWGLPLQDVLDMPAHHFLYLTAFDQMQNEPEPIEATDGPAPDSSIAADVAGFLDHGTG